MAALATVSQRLEFQLIDGASAVGGLTQETQRLIRNGAEAVIPLHIFSTLGARGTGEEVMRVCADHRIPAIFAESEMVEAGALISYGTNLLDEVRRAADMLVKVLRGTNPGDLPIDQVSEFELAVNLASARKTGMRVPPSILARATRMIE